MSTEDRQGNEGLKGEYTSTIENFSDLTDTKVSSPVFEIGAHLWGLGGRDGFLSIYLKCPEAALPLPPTAWFTFSLVNHHDPGAGSFSKESSHTWSRNEFDWGFTQFIPRSTLYDRDKGLLVDDVLQVKVEVEVE
eukprot:gene381-622_t